MVFNACYGRDLGDPFVFSGLNQSPPGLIISTEHRLGASARQSPLSVPVNNQEYNTQSSPEKEKPSESSNL